MRASMAPRCSRTGGPARAMRPVARALNLPFGITLPFGSTPGKNKEQQREELKQQLLELVKPTKMGFEATEELAAEIEATAEALIQLNPTPKTITSPLLNGAWQLLYTTSKGINGRDKEALYRLFPKGPIYQILDNRTLRARNKETNPFFNQVSANLEPVSDTKVAVKFDEFKIFGIIPVKSPPSSQGELATLYLDEELRVSRGNRNNLFILRMADPDATPDA